MGVKLDSTASGELKAFQMTKSTDKRLYRVIFQNQGKVFELCVRSVSQGGLFGFVEVEDLVFGEKSALLVDPSEDALKKEFENTKRIYIPIHSVVRIDEMEQHSNLKPRVVPIESGKKGESGESARITPIYTPPPNPFDR